MTLQEAYEEMYFDLALNKLEVILTPNKDRDGYIRSVTHQNPAWYRALCNRYPAHRRKPRRKNKFDTRIKRQNILKTLERLASGDSWISKYEQDLKEYAESIVRGTV